MKKITLPLIAAVLGLSNMNAQEGLPYNKWSIDINGGLTKPSAPMTPGYTGDTFFGLVHADAGVRYMFNNKFGIKADFGYDYMKNGEDSNYFRTTHYRASLQGVANLGRIMNFEEWTRTFGLQAHMGAGYSWMEPGKDGSTVLDYGKDKMGHVLLGLTGQVKLGNRVALNADFTMVNTVRQNYTFDGASEINANERGFNGTFYNATLGLSFYLGKNEQHADWYANDGLTNRVESLENRVTDIENKMIDSDNDGVADYLDLEPNTPAGNMVDTKGRSIDLNKNGIPDSYEDYFDSRYAKKGDTFSSADSNTAQDLINQGYVAVYFDFDKSTPKNAEATNFLITYLRSNPNATVEVNGFADSVGNPSYNQRLSEKRAKNVAKILEQSGISSSRITTSAKGEDTSFDGTNKTTSKFARRVTFKVN
ncbi:OmpA family protein [Paenimyroides viscosum]|uniref:OmpA family protein n=1 Tax=Paenimyroides viscosum TaxID=2488729 RepID=A0A3P1AYW2_9FLAO|nr:OmpA family protein [Paenimyroides viscosum]RRA93997.1 OmpA family protein [Paenimyroides viscosum]